MNAKSKEGIALSSARAKEHEQLHRIGKLFGCDLNVRVIDLYA